MSAEDSNGDEMAAAGRASVIDWLKRWAPILVIVAATGLAFAFGLHRYFTLSALIEHRTMIQAFIDAHLALALAIYFLAYVAAVALSFPGASVMTVVSGLLFGWVLAGTVTVVAATLGATVIFAAALTSFGRSMRDRAGPFMNKLAKGFRENAFAYLMFLRLTPVFPFWLVNLAPALFNVPIRTYVLATVLGIIPGTYTFAYLGKGLDSVIAAQEAAHPGCAAAGTCTIAIQSLVTRELIVALAALGVVSLVPILFKHWRARSH